VGQCAPRSVADARCTAGEPQVYTRHLKKTFLRRRPAPLEAG